MSLRAEPSTVADTAAGSPPDAAERVAPILAAGSLRTVFQALAASLPRTAQGLPGFRFGASGLLYQALLQGAPASLYASASPRQPEALLAAGRAAWARPFAANTLCLLCRAGFAPSGCDLLQLLLAPSTRVGISTPGADPSGDYALELFRRIEASGAAPPGSELRLRAKALALTGGASSRRPPGVPEGSSIYAALLLQGLADVMVVYRSNALAACQEQPALCLLELPQAWHVRAEYWLALMQPVQPAAQAFAQALLGPAGQSLLQRHGFLPATIPGHG